MTVRAPFLPSYGTTQNVSPAAASASATMGFGNKTIRVRNTGTTNMMYFRTGAGSATATAADMPVGPGESVYISKPQDHDTVAYISASGTTASITAGEGGY